MTKKKVEDERKIPVKNYLFLGIIIVVTLLAALYLFAWFKQYNDSKINTPVIASTLREVEYNDLKTVLKERDVLIMYMCTTDEHICRSFEKKFASYIKEHNLTEDVIYLNLGYNSDENNLIEKVYNNYKSDTLVKKVYDYPTLLIFNQGKIVDVLSSNKKNKISIDKVEELLKSYEL